MPFWSENVWESVEGEKKGSDLRLLYLVVIIHIIDIWVPNFLRFYILANDSINFWPLFGTLGTLLVGVKMTKATFTLCSKVEEKNTPMTQQFYPRVYTSENSGPWAPWDWPCKSSTVMRAKQSKNKNKNLETTQISSEEWIHKLWPIHRTECYTVAKKNKLLCAQCIESQYRHVAEQKQRVERYTQNDSITWRSKTCKTKQCHV